MAKATPMTKLQTISAIAEASGLSKKDVERVLSAQAALVADELRVRGVTAIHGITKLTRTYKEARTGVLNRFTQVVGDVPAKYVIKASVVKALKVQLQ